MLLHGILNPAILELLARFRHTNTIVIADRGFPFWPEVPTVDISLVDDVPTTSAVLSAVAGCCKLGAAFMADEFRLPNPPTIVGQYVSLLGVTPLSFESHQDLKRRVPQAVGLIRTAGTVQYSNIILESA